MKIGTITFSLTVVMTFTVSRTMNGTNTVLSTHALTEVMADIARSGGDFRPRSHFTSHLEKAKSVPKPPIAVKKARTISTTISMSPILPFRWLFLAFAAN